MYVCMHVPSISGNKYYYYYYLCFNSFDRNSCCGVNIIQNNCIALGFAYDLSQPISPTLHLY